jgi:hypothetical protein
MPDWDALFDEPFLALLSELEAEAQSGLAPWFLPEAWAAWRTRGEPTGLKAIGWQPDGEEVPQPGDGPLTGRDC